ncbi:hypothetical protein [Methylocystis parvus]|uniref:hypothetical protein n=1 Tax=Methylocystis parvus TaxID=134 RepID=UPI003C77696A
MSAARLLKQAREAGLTIGVSESGRLKCRGPAHEVERFKPVLVENRDALVEALVAECAYNPAALQQAADQRNADAIRARLTDRFCACGRIAPTAWRCDGRELWRCDDCRAPQ